MTLRTRMHCFYTELDIKIVLNIVDNHLEDLGSFGTFALKLK